MAKPRAPTVPFSSVALTFLGTASAQPSSTRNHSALALRLAGDVWLFDCGEATQHQLQRSSVKMGKINKVFITHTHGDHIFGLLPLMASRLSGMGGMTDGAEDPRTKPATSPSAYDEVPFEIYGPFGTRGYVRAGLTYTHTLLGSPYVVHELRLPSDRPPGTDSCPLPPHPHELPTGRDLAQHADGTWPSIFADAAVSVSAAPIAHSVPCVGYVVQEADVPGKIDPAAYVPAIKRANASMAVLRELQQGAEVALSDGTVLRGPPKRPGRKIAILGDTYDPSPIAELARGADVLVHEATNAHLPGVDPETKPEDTYESVEERTKSRGHSTPQMAGAFAKEVGARRLVLNHFSARYKSDEELEPLDAIAMEQLKQDPNTMEERHAKTHAIHIMRGIRHLAVEAYGSEEVVCARDFMSIDVEFVKQ